MAVLVKGERGGRWIGRVGGWCKGIPLEFVGKVSGASALAEARDIERSATATRHDE